MAGLPDQAQMPAGSFVQTSQAGLCAGAGPGRHAGPAAQAAPLTPLCETWWANLGGGGGWGGLGEGGGWASGVVVGGQSNDVQGIFAARVYPFRVDFWLYF